MERSVSSVIRLGGLPEQVQMGLGQPNGRPTFQRCLFGLPLVFGSRP